MFKKKKSNLYDSFEDEMKSMSKKEKELLDTYEYEPFTEEEADEVIEVDFDDEKPEIVETREIKVIKDDKEKVIAVDDYYERPILETENKNKEKDEYEDFNLENEENSFDYDEEEHYSLEDDDEDYEDEKKFKIRLPRLINIIFIILIIGMIMIAVDVICVARYNKGPFFAIPLKTYKDGGSKAYYGLGYKVIKYNQIQGRKDKVLGLWTMKYNIDPVTVQAVDLAIEFENDEVGSYKKYYKKFVRVISKLEKIDEKNGTLNIGYVDDGKKYSIDIICKLENKDSTSEVLEGKDITVIGTVSKYDFENAKKTGKLYIDNCFAEQ